MFCLSFVPWPTTHHWPLHTLTLCPCRSKITLKQKQTALSHQPSTSSTSIASLVAAARAGEAVLDRAGNTSYACVPSSSSDSLSSTVWNSWQNWHSLLCYQTMSNRPSIMLPDNIQHTTHYVTRQCPTHCPLWYQTTSNTPSIMLPDNVQHTIHYVTRHPTHRSLCYQTTPSTPSIMLPDNVQHTA